MYSTFLKLAFIDAITTFIELKKRKKFKWLSSRSGANKQPHFTFLNISRDKPLPAALVKMNATMNSSAQGPYNCEGSTFPESDKERRAFEQFCGCIIPPDTWHSVVEVVLSKLLLIISVLGNLLVIIVLQRMKRSGDHSGAMKLLIQNLCVADMAVCIIYNIYEFVGIDSKASITPVCKLIGGLSWTTLSASSCLICCVTAERYLAVVKPFDFDVNTRRTVLMVVFSWYYSLIFTLPDFYFLTRQEARFCGRGIIPFCSYDYIQGTDITVMLLMTLSATFLVPLIFIVAANIVVVRSLLQSQGSRLFRKFRRPNDQGRGGVVFIVLLLTAIFVLCSVPFATYLLLIAVSVTVPKEFAIVAYYLMLVNSTANAFVYSFFSSVFRRNCMELFSPVFMYFRSLLRRARLNL